MKFSKYWIQLRCETKAGNKIEASLHKMQLDDFN